MTKGLNKITQNETQDLQLVDNFCKSWEVKETDLDSYKEPKFYQLVYTIKTKFLQSNITI